MQRQSGGDISIISLGKQMLHTLLNICLGRHKNPRSQIVACFLRSSHMARRNHHLHEDSLVSGNAAMSWLQHWEQTGQQAAAKLFSLPQTTPKSDTSSSEHADTCRCLLALTTHKNGLSVWYASWIFLYHWERKILLGRSQQDKWYF